MKKVVIIALVQLVLAGVALAQDNEPPPGLWVPLVSDRPSFTTGPVLLNPGEWQLELGYTYADLEHGDSSTVPEALVRYGYNENWEFRLGWDGYSFLDDEDDFAHGASLGMKYRLWAQSEKMPAMSIISTLSLPTGNGPNDVDGQTLLGWDYAITDMGLLSGNIGVAAPTDAVTGDRFAQGIFSLMYSYPWQENTDCFGEYFTTFPAADDEDAEHVVQGGILHRLSEDFQLDFRLGAGLNSQAPDWLVGFGFTLRF